MTQSPYPPQDPQQQPAPPLANQAMNVYPTPGAYGPYPGQQAKAPAWPTVVGIISLCLAGISGVMTIVGLIINAAGIGTDQQRQMMASMPDWFKTYQPLVGMFSILTYVVLAVGGIMLLKRRRAGRALHLVYAVTAVLGSIFGLVVTITMMNHMAPPPNAPPPVAAIFKATMAASAIGGMAFALAYPTFLVIWFNRAKVKQHIQTWQR